MSFPKSSIIGICFRVFCLSLAVPLPSRYAFRGWLSCLGDSRKNPPIWKLSLVGSVSETTTLKYNRPGFRWVRVNFRKKLGRDTAQAAGPNWPNKQDIWYRVVSYSLYRWESWPWRVIAAPKRSGHRAVRKLHCVFLAFVYYFYQYYCYFSLPLLFC